MINDDRLMVADPKRIICLLKDADVSQGRPRGRGRRGTGYVLCYRHGAFLRSEQPRFGRMDFLAFWTFSVEPPRPPPKTGGGDGEDLWL